MMKLPLAQRPPSDDEDDGFDNDPELKTMEEKLKAKMKEIKESDNPNLFTFDDGDTVDFSLPPDTSFSDDVEADSDGYKPISWTQLKKKFCYERPAHGFKLCGDISQKLQEHWERSKQIKIRDSDGVEGAVFFYCEEAKPYFDWGDIAVGNNITVKSPRYHRFMDKQEGMRLEDAKQMCPIEKQKFTDSSRLDYGILNKDHGNKKFTDKKYEEAMEFYDTAIRHLRGSFKETPDEEPKAKELVAQCFLNIAQCHMMNKNYQYVEAPCLSALQINANQACNAKAYFRIGSASLQRKELNHAKTHLERALQLAPGDPKIVEAVNTLNKEIGDQKMAEKKLYKTQTAGGGKFGPRKWILSDLPETLADTVNFRDIVKVLGKSPFPAGSENQGLVLKKNQLYRSRTVCCVSKRDLKVLTESFGVKTVIDMRSDGERKMLESSTKKLLKTEAQQIKEGVTHHDGGEDEEKKEIIFHADGFDTFLPVVVTCKSKSGKVEGPPKIQMPKPQKGSTALSSEEVLSGRVTYKIDLSGRAVQALVPKWVFILAMMTAFIGVFFKQWWLLVAKALTHYSATKLGCKGLYLAILDHGKPEVREVFRILSKESNYPVVISCSMGKDRTGIITALALSAIGVPDSMVALDYHETEKNISEKDKKNQRSIGLPVEFDSAPQELMLDLLRDIKEKYGSVVDYLTKECDVTPEEIDSLKRCLIKNMAPLPTTVEEKKEEIEEEMKADVEEEKPAPTAGSGESKVEEIEDNEE